jgi:3-oxoacyl-[acyl-carrier-protein] synthase III
MTDAKILGFGGYQPDRVVTNDDLAKLVDTNDEWIRTRVGIRERRFARDDETVTDMAEAAGAKALAASGLEPSDIDLVTVATCSPESLMPTISATVAYRLGIVAPGAYDLNAACAGFCYAVGAAADSERPSSAGAPRASRRGSGRSSGAARATRRRRSSSRGGRVS